MAKRKVRDTLSSVGLAALTYPWVPLAGAQAPSSTTKDSSAPPSTLSTSATGSPTVSSSEPIRTSEFAPFTNPISTTSSSDPNSTASPTLPDVVASSNPTDSAPPQTSKEIEQEDQDNGLVNSYFAILAILILFVFLGMWLVHRRKKQAKARRITGRREALARDLDGWVQRDGPGDTAAGNSQTGFTRYWGHWRNWSDSFARREEGLNERGEAPPAYSPQVRPEESQTEQRVDLEAGTQQRVADDGRGVQIPLRTLSREEVPGLKPPEYMEIVRSTSPESEDGMPGSATISPALAHPPPSRDGNGVGSR